MLESTMKATLCMCVRELHEWPIENQTTWRKCNMIRVPKVCYETIFTSATEWLLSKWESLPSCNNFSSVVLRWCQLISDTWLAGLFIFLFPETHVISWSIPHHVLQRSEFPYSKPFCQFPLGQLLCTTFLTGFRWFIVVTIHPWWKGWYPFPSPLLH